MRKGHELGARRQQPLKLIEQQLAAIIDRRDAQLRASLVAQDLPGHDIGVVLHRGDQHFVARRDLRAAVGLRDEIDAFGGPADEDDFVRVEPH